MGKACTGADESDYPYPERLPSRFPPCYVPFMKQVETGLLAASVWLGASVAWGASFANSSDAQRPSPSHASLEEPPPDDEPARAGSRPVRTGWAAHTDRLAPFAGPRRNPDSVSFLFSPFYLLLPMVKLTGELSVVRHLGVAAFGGIGQSTIDFKASDGASSTFDATTYLLGTQVIGYPARSFDGVEVGAQLQYVYVDGQGKVGETSFAGTGSGFALGPFLGYKWITQVGFTALVQGGVQFLAVRGTGNGESGRTDTASDALVSPLLNLDFGWSF